MKINTNIDLRDRSKITLSGFKGLDTLSAPVDVSAIHATEMQNLISRDGVNHKRFGWKTQYRIRENGHFLEILGIFSFTIFHIDFLMVYAGCTENNKEKYRFYLIDTKNNTHIDITNWRLNEEGNIDKDDNENYIKTTVSPVNTDNLRRSECKCFINGNKVYFVGCGDYLVFSKWDNDKFELRRVVGNEDVYIPTTTENIGCEEEGQHYTRITAEERNILSPYTKNLLFGKSSSGSSRYFLDTKGFKDITVEIENKNGKLKLTKGVQNDDIQNIPISTINASQTKSCSFYNEKNANIETETITTTNTEITYGRDQKILIKTDTSNPTRLTGDWKYQKKFEFYETSIKLVMYSKIINNGIDAQVWLQYSDYSFDLMFRNLDEYNKFMNNASQFKATYKEYKLVTSEEKTYNYTSELSFNSLSGLELITFNDDKKLFIRHTIQSKKTLTKTLTKDNKDVVVTAKVPDTISYEICFNDNGKITVLSKSNPISSSFNLSLELDEEKCKGTLTSKIDYFNQKVIMLPDICKASKQSTDFSFKRNLDNENVTDYFSLVNNNNTYGKISIKTGELILDGTSLAEDFYAPLVPDIPNITVTIELNEEILPSFNKAVNFGSQGSSDRLFIIDDTGNTVRWSKDNNFTYFGEKSWCVCGTSDKSITGMDRLNDSTLLVVKEYSAKEPSIFIITSKIESNVNEAGKTKERVIFSPHGYQVGMGAVGEIVNFNGDCLMVAKDGLYAVSLGENMTVDSRYVLHRSRQISNKIEKFDLASAKCVSFNGKFFVAVGGEEQECYVADNKFTASFEGDMQNVVNYEWWRWTNIPVNVWGFVGNELWFGTNDGQLCCFTENFYDETLIKLINSGEESAKLLGYQNLDDEIIGFYLSDEIKFSNGDIFTPTCDLYGGITTDKFECIEGETRFYLPLNDYIDGEKIYINDKQYQITKHDFYFSIPYTAESSKSTIYRNYKNKPLTVMTDSSIGDTFIKLKDSAGYYPIWAKVGTLNPAQDNLSAIISHKEPVVAKWVSGAMDLGTRIYSKSLTYLVLTGEKNLANRLKYGLKTRFTHRDYELLRANNDLDFTKLDLQTVSMDSDFASSYAKRLNIRNINFLMFYYMSDRAEDIAIDSVEIEFKIQKRNIGVR